MTKNYNRVFLLMLFLCLGIFVRPAFSQAIEANATFHHAEHPVFENTYSQSPKMVRGALLARLQQDHISVKSKKNLISGIGVVYPDFAPTPLDLYFIVEGKSKKKKGPSILKIFISKGRDNFIGKQYDQELSQNALDFLNGFQKDVDRYSLKQDISKKEKDLRKTQSKYEKRLKDKQKLDKREADLNQSLSNSSEGKNKEKTRRKIHRTGKKLNALDIKIRKTENDLDRQKEDLQNLKDQLNHHQS